MSAYTEAHLPNFFALGGLAFCRLGNVAVCSLLQDPAEDIGKNSSHADLWETPLMIILHLEKWPLTPLYSTYSLTSFQSVKEPFHHFQWQLRFFHNLWHRILSKTYQNHLYQSYQNHLCYGDRFLLSRYVLTLCSSSSRLALKDSTLQKLCLLFSQKSLFIWALSDLVLYYKYYHLNSSGSQSRQSSL